MNTLSDFEKEVPFIEKLLDYTFRDKNLLIQAFIHKSFVNESPLPNILCNERLEFLGDSVLHLYVSHLLFTHFPDEPEGILSKQKSHLICQKNCSALMEKLHLTDHLLIAKGQNLLEGKARITLSSDLFEAILGAIFLDGNWPAIEYFFSIHFTECLCNLAHSPPPNTKAELQESAAKKGLPLPFYQLEKETGPPHKREFTISVLIDGQKLGEATGLSKREAEQEAAAIALTKMDQHEI